MEQDPWEWDQELVGAMEDAPGIRAGEIRSPPVDEVMEWVSAGAAALADGAREPDADADEVLVMARPDHGPEAGLMAPPLNPRRKWKKRPLAPGPRRFRPNWIC